MTDARGFLYTEQRIQPRSPTTPVFDGATAYLRQCEGVSAVPADVDMPRVQVVAQRNERQCDTKGRNARIHGAIAGHEAYTRHQYRSSSKGGVIFSSLSATGIRDTNLSLFFVDLAILASNIKELASSDSSPSSLLSSSSNAGTVTVYSSSMANGLSLSANNSNDYGEKSEIKKGGEGWRLYDSWCQVMWKIVGMVCNTVGNPETDNHDRHNPVQIVYMTSGDFPVSTRFLRTACRSTIALGECLGFLLQSKSKSLEKESMPAAQETDTRHSGQDMRSDTALDRPTRASGMGRSEVIPQWRLVCVGKRFQGIVILEETSLTPTIKMVKSLSDEQLGDHIMSINP
ncbi:hypothetical protein BU17DRAFT_69590 [Hysterangium stoloniferum]|nr:hypothetical protein BU17DRAFT_69590 [Hysterangium stoloniferum]